MVVALIIYRCEWHKFFITVSDNNCIMMGVALNILGCE